MAFTTNEEVAIREDLHDLISVLDPTEVPLHVLLEHIPAGQPIIEYTVDDYGIDRTTGNISTDAQAEAADQTAAFPAAPVETRLQAQTQINWENFEVSESSRASQFAGRADQFDWQAYRALMRVVTQQEMALTWGTGGGTAVDRETQGLVSWAAYTGLERLAGSSGNLTDPYGVVIPDQFWSTFYNANGVTLDLDTLSNTIFGNAWQQGFVVPGSITLCGQKMKQLISAFALTSDGAINERQIPAYDRFLVDTLDAIRTPMGVTWINLNRWFEIPGQSITVDNTGAGGGTQNVTVPCDETIVSIMPRHVKIGVLRGTAFKPLPNTADSSRGVIVGEEGLVVYNPIGICGGTNLLA